MRPASTSFGLHLKAETSAQNDFCSETMTNFVVRSTKTCSSAVRCHRLERRFKHVFSRRLHVHVLIADIGKLTRPIRLRDFGNHLSDNLICFCTSLASGCPFPTTLAISSSRIFQLLCLSPCNISKSSFRKTLGLRIL